jgi:hypothetical protein
MSVIIVLYSLTESDIPGGCPLVGKSSDGIVESTSKTAIEEMINLVEYRELDVLHPTTYFYQPLDMVNNKTWDLQYIESDDLFSHQQRSYVQRRASWHGVPTSPC